MQPTSGLRRWIGNAQIGSFGIVINNRELTIGRFGDGLGSPFFESNPSIRGQLPLGSFPHRRGNGRSPFAKRRGGMITGIKRIHRPVVGDLDLAYEAMTLRSDSDLTTFVSTAEPGSKTDEGLRLLASWTASLDSAELARVVDET